MVFSLLIRIDETAFSEHSQSETGLAGSPVFGHVNICRSTVNHRLTIVPNPIIFIRSYFNQFSKNHVGG